MHKYLLFTWIIIFCINHFVSPALAQNKTNAAVITGAAQFDEYLPLIQSKKVALLVNHTSVIDGTHLLDHLISRKVNVIKVFAPEHGFRGNQANGELIDDDIDTKSGLPIVSLYGKNKRPSKEQMAEIDVVIFDIQDVGARFYTYISVMHYMMEACAENNVQMIILDRPNPNAAYVDGPVLEPENSSYIGMHQIPVVYGMTEGELAKMILGEKWMNTGDYLDLKIIKLKNWTHKTVYELPIAPSPNLPNAQSVGLYPSLCFFERTNVSLGRGTEFPFQVLGTLDSTMGTFTFKPVSIPTASKYPKHENKMCYGIDLRKVNRPNELDLSYILDFYNRTKDKSTFFMTYFVRLSGTKELQQQIEQGLSEEEIRASWQPDLNVFKEKRKKYLLYED